MFDPHAGPKDAIPVEFFGEPAGTFKSPALLALTRLAVHSFTFSQRSFAMAAGLAALDVMDRHGLVRREEQIGNQIGEASGP